MDEVRKRDFLVFVQELLAPRRLLLLGVLAGGMFLFRWAVPWELAVTLSALAGGLWVLTSFVASIEKRFRSNRHKILWEACEDRLKRLNRALKLLKKSKVAHLSELPRTVETVGRNLYLALRRADTVLHEVSNSERGMHVRPVVNPAPIPVPDQQAQELYRIADRNVVEYRQHFDAVMGGVHRTEAQAAVFTTTLDSLRMKILGYRLVGGEGEMNSGEFLGAMTEARMQLDAIDKALEELELAPFPGTIAVDGETLRRLTQPPSNIAATQPDPVRQNLSDTPPPIPPDANITQKGATSE